MRKKRELTEFEQQQYRRAKWTMMGILLVIATIMSSVGLDGMAATLWLGLIIGLFISPYKYVKWIAPLSTVWSLADFPMLADSLSVFLAIAGTVAVVAYNKRGGTWLPAPKEKLALPEGMTKRDRDVFTAIYQRANASVRRVEELMMQYKQTRQINVEYQTIQYADAVLAELKRDPLSLTRADEFIYTHLPNLEKLLETYHEIAQHAVHDEDDYRRAAEGREVIKALSRQIKADYKALTEDDYDDLAEQIDWAKESLKKGDN